MHALDVVLSDGSFTLRQFLEDVREIIETGKIAAYSDDNGKLHRAVMYEERAVQLIHGGIQALLHDMENFSDKFQVKES